VFLKSILHEKTLSELLICHYTLLSATFAYYLYITVNYTYGMLTLARVRGACPTPPCCSSASLGSCPKSELLLLMQVSQYSMPHLTLKISVLSAFVIQITMGMQSPKIFKCIMLEILLLQFGLENNE